MKSHVKAELDRYYRENWDEYNKKLAYYKALGFKILRNPQGLHRIEYAPNLEDFFNGAFKNIFKK